LFYVCIQLLSSYEFILRRTTHDARRTTQHYAVICFNDFVMETNNIILKQNHFNFPRILKIFSTINSSTTSNHFTPTTMGLYSLLNHSFSTSNYSFSTPNHSLSTPNHSFSTSKHLFSTTNHSLVNFIGLVFASNKYLFQMKNYFLPRAPQHKLLIWYKVLLFSFQTLTKVILISNQIIV